MQWSQPEPEWDWIDVALMTGWAAVNDPDDRCACGRPRAVHDTQTADEYHTGYSVCPAIAALDAAQAARAVDDEHESAGARERASKPGASRVDRIKARLNPDRARSWHVWHRDEPTPT